MIKITLIRMKLIIMNKFNLFVLLFSLGVFVLLINSLSLGAKERSNIPIGLVNLDYSKTANQLVNNVKAVPALYVYEEREEKLKELLYNEEIQAYFIIKEGYEAAIKEGKLNDIIEMYYLDNNNAVKIISDIFAGEMLYKICSYKGINIYKELSFNWDENFADTNSLNQQNDSLNQYQELIEEEYEQYADSIKDSPELEFTFDIKLWNLSNNTLQQAEIQNSLLYQQIIVGILGMLIAFIAMFLSSGTVIDKENGIDNRIRISALKVSELAMSQILLTTIIQGSMSFIFTIILYIRFEFGHYLQFVSLYLLILLFSFLYVLWFMLIGKLINGVGKYQVMGVFSIFIFGIMSFLHLFRGFFHFKILNILKFVPNSWFIDGFTDIILKNNFYGIKFYTLIQLIITAFMLILINEIIGRRQIR